MKGKSSTLLLSYLLLVAVVAVGLCRRIGARPDENVALTGSVPADQSFPFDAESFLAEADCPECTIFEFEVNSGNNPEVDLSSFTLTSAEGQNALAGDFSLPASEADSTMFAFANTSQSVTIDFTRLPEGKLTVTRDRPATFAVVALPRAYSGLSVTFTGEPIGTKTLKLDYSDGAPITFKALKRHRVHGLSLPDANEQSSNKPL